MITGDKLLAYAKRIISKSSIPEEESRSAISLAYYSLYHEGLAVAISKFSLNLIRNIERNKGRHLRYYERTQLNALDPNFLKTCNFHRILPKTFLDIGQRPLANMFKDLRVKRNKSDYDLKSTVTYSEATTIVNNAEDLVGQVKSL